MTWLFSNKLHTSFKEQQGQKARHISFDECAFGSNDGWSWETNWIADHGSGYVVKEEESGCSFLFIRWVLAIRDVVESATTESLLTGHNGMETTNWKSYYYTISPWIYENSQWWLTWSINGSVHSHYKVTSLFWNCLSVTLVNFK